MTIASRYVHNNAYGCIEVHPRIERNSFPRGTTKLKLKTDLAIFLSDRAHSILLIGSRFFSFSVIRCTSRTAKVDIQRIFVYILIYLFGSECGVSQFRWLYQRLPVLDGDKNEIFVFRKENNSKLRRSSRIFIKDKGTFPSSLLGTDIKNYVLCVSMHNQCTHHRYIGEMSEVRQKESRK